MKNKILELFEELEYEVQQKQSEEEEYQREYDEYWSSEKPYWDYVYWKNVVGY